MERKIIQKMIEWKKQSERKPLLLDGARQTGKTWAIEKLFGPRYFRRVHTFDFRLKPTLHELFIGTLEPEALLKNLSLFLGEDIDTRQDLIFFDEIGECQRAVDSLKYFSELRADVFVCASGSNIGLLESFPVGKIQLLDMYPMHFEEFLMASEEEDLLENFQKQSRLIAVHQRLWQHLLDYYFVGGMPEAVNAWFQLKSEGIHYRCNTVTRIHQNLIEGYHRDFGKYSGKADAMHIESVFHNIPIQLACSVDDSVKRYKFKGVIPKKNRYQELSTPIDWLCKSKLAIKNKLINCQPRSPLKALAAKNLFKLYFFDIGLLGHLLDIGYQEQMQQKMIEKGFIAENFVQTELSACMGKPSYYWSERNSEIEFLIKLNSGAIMPVEVKSGKRTMAKSLKVYKEKYQPDKTLKLVGTVGGNLQNQDQVWPLYYAAFIAGLQSLQ